MTAKTPHPVIAQLRELRKATGMSLQKVEERYGIPAIVVGSWERGDRHPNVEALQRLLDVYGYDLVAAPRAKTLDGRPAVRTAEQNAALLRSIADQLTADPDEQTWMTTHLEGR